MKDNNFSSCFKLRAVGVPPPTYIVSKFLCSKLSSSIINASKYSSTGWFLMSTFVKSQYVHIRLQNGIWIYKLFILTLPYKIKSHKIWLYQYSSIFSTDRNSSCGISTETSHF